MDGIGRTAPLQPSGNPVSPFSFSNESARSGSSLAASGNPEEILHLSVNGGPDECGRWTDEKHDIFLSLLEASFVKQMHKPMTAEPRFQDHAKAKTNMSQKLCTNKSRAYNQISVAQDPSWHEINIERELANHGTASISHGSCKDKQISLFSHSDIQVLGSEEGSGQNFVDEGNEEKINIDMYALDHQVKMKILSP
ncbi:unnamed protein product [Cuscuta campestris]|uniref:Uncharacterized protein n=1 Tax=Cuscuta campestris TaxID=132261 RepID=A0A484KYB4_9ASTE|nr:unnamed protein product [Cuscuta campestris]